MELGINTIFRKNSSIKLIYNSLVKAFTKMI
jgi:hypothetical protein